MTPRHTQAIWFNKFTFFTTLQNIKEISPPLTTLPFGLIQSLVLSESGEDLEPQAESI